MNNLLHIAASNSVFALLLAVVVLVVTRIWRNPHLAHALWALVLIKLITPPLADIPVAHSWFAVDSAEELAAADAESPIDANAALRSSPPPSVGLEAGDDDPDPAMQPPVTVVTDLTQSRPESAAVTVSSTEIGSTADTAAINWSMLIVGIWCSGSAVMAVAMVRRIVRFRRLLSTAEPPPDSVLAATRRLATAIGLRRCPELCVVHTAIPPLVWSLGLKPRIVVPAQLLEALGESQRDSVIAHELAHIRRRDDLTRWLEFAVLVTWWWNPIAWFARRKLHEAEEACCDAWVISVLPGERRSYGQALLKTIEFLSEPATTAVPIGSAFGVSFYQRRVEMIMNRQVSRKMSVSALAMALLVALIVLPLGAQTSPPETPSTTAPPQTRQSEPGGTTTPVEPMTTMTETLETTESAETGESSAETTRPEKSWPKPVDPAPPFCTVRGVILNREQLPVSRHPVWIIGKRDNVTLLYSDGPTGEDGSYEFGEIPANVSWQVFVPFGNGPDGIATRGYELQPDAAADVRIVLTGDYSFEYTVNTNERGTASEDDAGGAASPAEPEPRSLNLSISQHADERGLQKRLLMLDIEAAEAAWEQAKVDLDRLQKLGNAVSGSEVTKQQTKVRESQIEWERAKTFLELFQLQSQRADLSTNNDPTATVQIATGKRETTIQLPKVQYEILSFRQKPGAGALVSQWSEKNENQGRFETWLEENVHSSPAQIGAWLNNHGAGVVTVTMTGPVDLDAVREQTKAGAEQIEVGPWGIVFHGRELILIRHVQQSAPEPTPLRTY